MSRFGHLILLAALTLATTAVIVGVGSCRGSALMTGLGIELKLDVRKLPNGLTVVFAPDAASLVASYQTWVRVGSVDEQPGKTGLAHLFEHLMFKGTTRFDQREFFRSLEAKGAEVNAFTTRDYTVFYQTLVPALLPRAIELEADRLMGLQLLPEKLETERQIVFEERSLRTDNAPAGRMQEALWALAYKVHPYGNPVIGYPQDLATVSLGDLETFYRRYYHPANTLIVVSGNVDVGATWRLIELAYGRLPKLAPPARRIATEPKQREERRLVLRERVPSARLSLAYHVPSARDADSYAIDVLSSILFDGTSSRAYRRLVDEQPILRGVSGSAFTPRYPGLWLIGAEVREGIPIARAEAELLAVLETAKTLTPTREEISRAVRQLTIELVDSARSPQGLGQLIGTIFMVLEDPKQFNEGLERYLRVSADDVIRVAQQVLEPNNRTVVQLLPDDATEKPSPTSRAEPRSVGPGASR